MIAAAWYGATKKTNKIVVYNCTSGQINKITWGMFEDYGLCSFLKYPFENIFFFPDPHFTSHKTVKYVRTFCEQLLPAYTMDFFLKIFQKKPL
jgi:fatty acyl-CoA reductase